MELFLNLEQLGKLAYLFAMGVVSSLTPCVYPLIPITVSLFGVTPDSSRGRAFLLSSTYVAGMATTYTALGMLSAKTGMLFGSLLGHPLVIVVVALLLSILALHSLEVIQLPFAKLQSKAGKLGGSGFFGVYVLGLVSGAVAAPCVGPVLVVLLLEAAQTPSVVMASLQLFTYALGMGMLFILVGTFSGVLGKLPKSGAWLGSIKFLISVALFGMVARYLSVVAPAAFLVIQKPALLLFISFVALGILYILRSLEFSHQGALRATAAALFGLVIFEAFFFEAGHHVHEASADNRRVEWHENLDVALQQAKRLDKPLMVDLYAQWCASCKELAHTFEDHAVADALTTRLVAARIDLTSETAESEALQEKYGVVGLPSVLFLNADGTEQKELRITGAMSPSEFLAHLTRMNKQL